jgi:molybdopterin-containing oxidoreductase family iron-sulfur binding subunit
MHPLYKGFNDVQSVTLVKADGEHEFACVQGQKTLMGRGYHQRLLGDI